MLKTDQPQINYLLQGLFQKKSVRFWAKLLSWRQLASTKRSSSKNKKSRRDTVEESHSRRAIKKQSPTTSYCAFIRMGNANGISVALGFSLKKFVLTCLLPVWFVPTQERFPLECEPAGKKGQAPPRNQKKQCPPVTQVRRNEIPGTNSFQTSEREHQFINA